MDEELIEIGSDDHMITINDVVIKQPDAEPEYNFETTYREDAGRSMAGGMYAEPLFSVEQLSFSWSSLNPRELSQILRIVAKGGAFSLHYYSPYYGTWRTAPFRVAKGSLQISTLEYGRERFSSLSFNVTGDEPI